MGGGISEPPRPAGLTSLGRLRAYEVADFLWTGPPQMSSVAIFPPLNRGADFPVRANCFGKASDPLVAHFQRGHILSVWPKIRSLQFWGIHEDKVSGCFGNTLEIGLAPGRRFDIVRHTSGLNAVPLSRDYGGWQRMVEYFLAWWNLENLFDVENSPTRPAWLQKRLHGELKGWNQAVLNSKLVQLAKVIKKMNNDHGPDILGVCEVENEVVMNQLVAKLAPLGRNYAIAHEDTQDKRGIDVGFIFDADKFSFEQKFSHAIMKREATRELFQVNLKTKPAGGDLVLVGNHWPSRSGGELQSEPYRMMAGETLSYWLKRIQEEKGKDAQVVVMGDFNDEPHDRSLTDYLLSTQTPEKVESARNPRLWNLMWPLMGQAVGTHYFEGFPNMLDQFLVSRGFLNGNGGKVKPGSVKIEKYSGMSAGTYGGPRRFGRPSDKLDQDGFSDHFPISMVVQA